MDKASLNKLCDEVRADPKSVFVSYGWDNDNHKEWVLKFSEDIQSFGFKVYLDQAQNFDVGEMWLLGICCQNIVTVLSDRYMQSCLGGHLSYDPAYGIYPSFAIPRSPGELDPNELLNDHNILKVGMFWQWIFENILVKGKVQDRSLLYKQYHSLIGSLPDSWRIFAEGWALDEYMMISLNETKYRSISSVLKSGNNCFDPYMTIDFRKNEDYEQSLHTLVNFLRNPRKGHNSALCKDLELQIWTMSNKDILVIKPSICDHGRASMLIQEYKDWIPLNTENNAQQSFCSGAQKTRAR